MFFCQRFLKDGGTLLQTDLIKITHSQENQYDKLHYKGEPYMFSG